MKKLWLFLAVLCGFCSSAIADNAQVVEAYGKIPLAFTLNQGQTDTQVKFATAGNGCSIFFAPTGTTFLLSRETAQSAAKRASKKAAGSPEDMIPARNTEREYESFAVKTVFVGANQSPEMVGEDRLPWNNNYFVGSDPAKWRTDVPNYGKIRLKEVYSGIDLVYYGNKDRIKYDFVVKPGEDPSKVLLKYDLGASGGNALSINSNGDLVVKTPLGDIIERKPYCYQKINGKEVEVSIGYRIVDASRNSFGFDIGAFDSRFDLYVDPELAYSTFLGTDNNDSGLGIAVDSSGNAYVTGIALSSFYPTTTGAYDTSINGEYDVFVTKLNALGSSLVYSTFLGGGKDDDVCGIVVDSSGNAYVTGITFSSGYPATTGAYYTSKKADSDIFITKLNASGSSLVYSTFLGVDDYTNVKVYGIAVDSSGNAYVTGYTHINPDNASSYPTTTSAYDTSQNGMLDVFVTKLNASGSGLVYSTFLGGSRDENVYGIAVDNSGNAYVTGWTGSSDFPTTGGAYDTSHNGGNDAFVTKLNASGGSLVYSTFLGGSGYESGYGIAVDSSGNAYVTGFTNSTNYPVTSGAYDTTQKSNEAFVTKLNDSGSLVYSTFLGGSGADVGSRIAVDSSGNACVTGWTGSSDYPTTSDAYDTSHNGGNDAFVTKLNDNGSSLVYSTFLGGSNSDTGFGIAVDSFDNVYVTGWTSSSDYPATTGAYDTSQNGVNDAFVTKLSLGVTTITPLSPPSNLNVSDTPDDQGHSLHLTWTASPSEQGGLVSYYRIYRSLSYVLSDSIKTLSQFTDIKDVTAWERHAAVLVDSVAAGTAEYTDNALGLADVPYYYWIQAVGPGGVSAKIASGTPTAVKERNALPAAFRLGEARPNPFNPSTTIEYSLPRNTRALLQVYNISGQKVATLVDGTVSAGDHFAVWDAKGMPSGVYFYSLKADQGFIETKKALLLK